jgi:hypothetical protein
MFASLEEIFCSIDDFCKYFDKNNQNYFLANSTKKRNKPCNMSLSEIMTIIILFHISHYRTFKYYYIDCVQRALKAYFPRVVSYNRFVELMESSLMPLTIFLHGITGKETGIYFADSTSLDVCHIKREKRHKVFKGIATKGKNSMGWFFGLKLHLIINNEGELMACKITAANVYDRSPVAKLMEKLQGWLFADKGYLGQPIIMQLKKQAVDIFTKVRKNMKARIMTEIQEFFLGKRGIVETVIDQLKNCCQIEHSRHRSPTNAFVNIISGLIAYCFKPRKPTIKLNKLNLQKLLLTSN